MLEFKIHAYYHLKHFKIDIIFSSVITIRQSNKFQHTFAIYGALGLDFGIQIRRSPITTNCLFSWPQVNKVLPFGFSAFWLKFCALEFLTLSISHPISLFCVSLERPWQFAAALCDSSEKHKALICVASRRVAQTFAVRQAASQHIRVACGMRHAAHPHLSCALERTKTSSTIAL